MFLTVRVFVLCVLVFGSAVIAEDDKAFLRALQNLDEVEAVKWARKAAEQGHTQAQFLLAFMYVHGRGVTQDDAEAVKWYRKAAEQGHDNAQFNLGAMYAKGRGILQDNVQAYAWLNIAAAQGLAPATEARDFVAQRMTYEDRESAQRLAQQYWEAYVLPFQD